MSCYKKLAGTTALASLLLASPAFADVTPQQVWDDFKGYLEGYGYQVEASESLSGGTLTVRDIAMTVPLPEEDGTMSMTMQEMVFTADGGAVDVSWPAEMPLDINVVADGEAVDVSLLYKTAGMDMTVSGDPGDMAWDFNASSLGVSLNGVTVDGETLGRDVARGDLVLNDVASTTAMQTGGMRSMTQTMTVGALTYDIAARDPDNAENNLLIKGALNGLTYGGSGMLPVEFDPEDPAAIFRAGFEIDGTFAFADGNSQFNFVDGNDAVAFQSKSGGGEFDVKMDKAGWGYNTIVRDLDMQMSGGDIPFPMSFQAAAFGGGVTIPVAKTDAPQDVALSLNLSDFQMSDMIWQMADPGAQLPRDPITVMVDLTGKARMLFDLYDPKQVEMMEDADMPAELHSVTLNNLMVKAVGAMLTGTGAFTFDNSDLETFGGLPKPTGEINAEVTGANALIDKLIGMGLLPEQEAMGFRMMMSMFTVATGDDKLSSKLEINEQGHILANGQRIQ